MVLSQKDERRAFGVASYKDENGEKCNTFSILVKNQISYLCGGQEWRWGGSRKRVHSSAAPAQIDP